MMLEGGQDRVMDYILKWNPWKNLAWKRQQPEYNFVR